jgi:hypothetical protein
MHVACVNKKRAQDHSFLPKPSLPLQHNIKLATTNSVSTLGNLEFDYSNKDAMDIEASVETKTNDDENTLGALLSLNYLDFSLQITLV